MNTDKHIVHVTEAVGGGVLVWIKEVCKELLKRNWRVTVVYDSKSSGSLSNEQMTLPHGVELLPMDLARTLSPSKLTKSIKGLSSYFHQESPAVIHLHSSFAGMLGRLAAKRVGLSNRVIYSPHGLAFLRQDVPWVFRKGFWLAEWFGARLGGLGVACSKGELEKMGSLYKRDRLFLVENSVDIESVPQKISNSNKIPIVGTIGRITAQKAPDHFAELSQSLSNENVTFLWIGDGDEEAHSRLCQAGVEVTGWLDRDSAMARLSEVDIYLSTALWEGMPLALIEAQVAGIPAVVSDVVGNRDVVSHKRTGYIASKPEVIRGYIQRLLHSEELRKELGEQARETAVARFNVNRMINDLEKLYMQVINKSD